MEWCNTALSRLRRHGSSRLLHASRHLLDCRRPQRHPRTWLLAPDPRLSNDICLAACASRAPRLSATASTYVRFQTPARRCAETAPIDGSACALPVLRHRRPRGLSRPHRAHALSCKTPSPHEIRASDRVLPDRDAACFRQRPSLRISRNTGRDRRRRASSLRPP